MIDGVRPSRNQATVDLRIIACEQNGEFPAAALVVEEDTYANDCGTGTTQPDADKKADKLVTDIQKLLAKGGFITKGSTRSGSPPPLGLSKDGVSINVFGANAIPGGAGVNFTSFAPEFWEHDVRMVIRPG